MSLLKEILNTEIFTPVTFNISLSISENFKECRY